ncbi:hypothetical protein IMW75_11760 [Pseudomonas gregormendelii]|uniref:PX domain-containing protein n=1 Tax=Pseudomonas gregormendelii TaxID=1628277 RepID=A0ABS3AHQ0_9PSED|nr:hypothetical protein [Pseudomonas gregormendelii]MBN3965950.1 hypothetical protein [Pseudomonas gregormendelii]
MTENIQTAYSFASAARRYIAYSPPPAPISPTKNNIWASLESVSNTTYLLHPIAKRATPEKPASLFKRLIQFFQCEKSTTLHRFDFFGAPFDIDVSAIRRSRPGEELHIRFSKEIISLYRRTLVIERDCQSKFEKTAPEKERVIIAQNLKKTRDQLEHTQAELERLKIACGKHHIYDIELNLLIDTCSSFRKKLETGLIAYIDKHRTVSTEKIKQLCSESGCLVEKTEQLLKTTDHKFSKNAKKIRKDVLMENIDHSRTAIENALDAIRNNMTWYSNPEFMELHNALKKSNEAARKLNFKEFDKKLAAVTTEIPRAKLKSPRSPTQTSY